eukprot:354029-Chlamydomonas_euryale.AAC.2
MAGRGFFLLVETGSRRGAGGQGRWRATGACSCMPGRWGQGRGRATALTAALHLPAVMLGEAYSRAFMLKIHAPPQQPCRFALRPPRVNNKLGQRKVEDFRTKKPNQLFPPTPPLAQSHSYPCPHLAHVPASFPAPVAGPAAPPKAIPTSVHTYPSPPALPVPRCSTACTAQATPHRVHTQPSPPALSIPRRSNGCTSQSHTCPRPHLAHTAPSSPGPRCWTSCIMARSCA